MDEDVKQTPKMEVNEVRPSSLAHLIGQTSVKRQVAVAVEASFADARRFDHALLTGAPGLGKSALASTIAAEMATEFHEVLGQSVCNPADLNALLLAAKDRDVVHIDEAHELRRPMQTALFLALDKRVLITGADGGRKPQPIPLADFTVLLSTTDEFKLLQPLRDRMRLNLRFEFYSEEELVEVVRQRVQALRWQADEAIAQKIATRARGTPRIALRLLQASYRVSRASGETTIATEHLERACTLEQLDVLGLNVTEQRYLQLLLPCPQRLNMLAMSLGIPSRTVSEVTENFLVRLGLITKSKEGLRELTLKGREHIVASSCQFRAD